MFKKASTIANTVATATFALSLFAALPAGAASYVTLRAGDIIKLPDDGNAATTVDTAIYYFGTDGLRYVFPNSKTYFTWYSGFSGVKVVGMEQLGTIRIGGNVTYRPGSRLIKIESDPSTYAIDHSGTRRHITSEAVAIALFGSNWNHQIDDVADAFFSNYPLGSDIMTASDYSVDGAKSGSPTVSDDRDMVAPIEVMINSDGSFTPSTITVGLGRTVRFTNHTGAMGRVASNPHPVHTDLPGFDSGDLPDGLNYVYKFKRVGTFGFHNHLNPSMLGSVTVTGGGTSSSSAGSGGGSGYSY